MALKRGDDMLCFLCDYGLYIFALLLVVIALFLSQIAPLFGLPGVTVAPLPPVSGNPNPPVQQPPDLVQLTVTPVDRPVITPTLKTTDLPATQMITAIEATESVYRTPEFVTPTPTPDGPPEYVIAFIPLHWSGTRENFLDSARRQGDYFVQVSGIDRYFDIRYLYFEEGYAWGTLSDDDLLTNMMAFALQREAADRYVGITDGDLAPGGRTWVAGYTYGLDEQGVVSEIGEDTIVAHELGHTFGLCDEYNYAAWESQNAELVNGCPNPYPEHCPKNSSVVNECDGTSSQDGLMSLMAAAGPASMSSYNESCYYHLQTVFAVLSGASRIE